jgi:hypothetical protein
MGHARLASGGQAPTSGQLLWSGPMPAAAGGQVNRMTPLGQSFQDSRPPPPVTARIITEPRAVSQSFHPALPGPTGACWLDDPPDLSCKERTRRHAMDDRCCLVTAGSGFSRDTSHAGRLVLQPYFVILAAWRSGDEVRPPQITLLCDESRRSCGGRVPQRRARPVGCGLR